MTLLFKKGSVTLKGGNILKLGLKFLILFLVLVLGCKSNITDSEKDSVEELLLKIQEDMPPGWTCVVVRDNGKMGHPHGLDEPEFRVDYVNKQVRFSPENVNPIIPLFFYSIESKSHIMKIVAEEAMFSWAIPVYFGETEECLVITSPAYVNQGIFTEEAKNMIKPMWRVLRRYILNIEKTNIDQLAGYS